MLAIASAWTAAARNAAEANWPGADRSWPVGWRLMVTSPPTAPAMSAMPPN